MPHGLKKSVSNGTRTKEMHTMLVSMTRPKPANRSPITSAPSRASCFTTGGRNANGKACLKSEGTRSFGINLERHCQLCSGCRNSAKSPIWGIPKPGEATENGHLRDASQFLKVLRLPLYLVEQTIQMEPRHVSLFLVKSPAYTATACGIYYVMPYLPRFVHLLKNVLNQ